MAQTYRIKPGFSFRDGDTVKVGGDTIELDLDMAILHRDKVEPITESITGPATVQIPVATPVEVPDTMPTVQTSAQVLAADDVASG